MELPEDTILERDVQKALNAYLNMGEELSKERQKTLINTLLTQIEKAKKKDGAHERDPVKQLSLAVQACALAPSKEKQLRSLLLAEIKARNAQTLALCPEMCIQFQDLAWSDYYAAKSNIKYPDVRGMTPKLCADSLTQKLMLFDLLQGHRQQCCEFQLPDFVGFVDKLLDMPAIIIPSGGKNGAWLGNVLKNKDKFWWVRFVNLVHVVFVVSSVEVGEYAQFEEHGITVVQYDGFGMGCGRAAGVHVAKKLNRMCFMTDDRTVDLECGRERKSAITIKLMKAVKEQEETYPWISGVLPKGELNILTIINPKCPAPERPTFSKCFIASKEDKALFLYCEALRVRNPTSKVGKTAMNFLVKFDAANPPWSNVAVNYTGRKGECIKCVTACPLYCSSAKDGATLDWAYLSSQKGFLNHWDAVKMQDSAMYLLLETIVKEMQESEALDDEFWLAFDQYVTPWFS